MRGNRTNIVFKGLLFIAVLFLFSSCMTYQDIEFKKVNSYSMGQVKNGRVNFIMNVRVFNPNWYKIKIVKGEMDLSLGGNDAGQAYLTEKIKLKGKEERDYDIIVEADFQQLTKAVLAAGLSVLITKTAVFRMKGWIKGRVFVFGKKFPVEFKENIDLNQFKKNN